MISRGPVPAILENGMRYRDSDCTKSTHVYCSRYFLARPYCHLLHTHDPNPHTVISHVSIPHWFTYPYPCFAYGGSPMSPLPCRAAEHGAGVHVPWGSARLSSCLSWPPWHVHHQARHSEPTSNAEAHLSRHSLHRSQDR